LLRRLEEVVCNGLRIGHFRLTSGGELGGIITSNSCVVDKKLDAV
jgi:hypothetical protein